MNKEEKIALAWCDNGMVHGEFAMSIAGLVNKYPEKITKIIRSNGKNIYLQRQQLLDYWMDSNSDTEWLLWIDSDIEFSENDFNNLINSANKENCPVVSGVYYLFMGENNVGLIEPKFSFKAENYQNLSGLKKVEWCGFGMFLIHKSVVEKLYEVFKDKHLFFKHQENRKDETLGEDVYFCKHINEIGIPIYVNFDVHLKHHKYYPLDKNYFNVYNSLVQKDWEKNVIS